MSPLGALVLAAIVFFVLRAVLEARARRIPPAPPPPRGADTPGDVIDVEVIERDRRP